MATNARRSQEGSDVRPKYIFLGVDTNGSHHVAYTPTETIRIVHPDGSRKNKGFYEGPVDGLDDYVDYIEELGGWKDRRYGRDLIKAVTEPLVQE